MFSQKLSLLNKSGTSTPITTAIKLILGHQVSGVTLNEISYNKSSDGLAVVNLAGMAQTRGQLLAFIAAFRSDSVFKKVDSPVSNLIKERRVDFTLTLQINGK